MLYHPCANGQLEDLRIAAEILEGRRVVMAGRDRGTLAIGHPSGVMTVRVRAHPTDVPDGVVFDELGMSRTARRLMECSAFYPAAGHTPLGRRTAPEAQE